MTSDLAEKRRAPRAVVSWRGALVGEALRSIDARVIDISSVGAAAMIDVPLQPGVKVVLDCAAPLPDAPQTRVTLRIESTVVRQEMKGQGFRVGLAFGAVSDEARRLIEAWVANAGLRHWR